GLQRDQQRFLRQIFGRSDVAEEANEPADQPGGFDPPDCLDGLACRTLVAHERDAHPCFSRRSPSARRRSSCSRSSGVSASPKSSASNTGRSSTSAPPSKGARLSHSTASSIDFTCHSQKPAMSSLVSANGP